MRVVDMKRIILSLFAVIAISTAFMLVDNLLNPAYGKDCSASAVAKCGVWSVSELRKAYNNDSTPGLKNIFNGMGISSNMINNSTIKEGTVGKDGKVKVDGKVVATDASSAGRTVMSHTTQRVKRTHGGTTYYESPTSDSFRSKTLASYVILDKDGRFQGAVVKDCGNPVKGKPVTPTPEPKPEPKPEPETMVVCVLKTKEYPVTIDKDDFNPKKHSTDSEDCQEKPKPEPETMVVCVLKTKEYPVTINKSEYNGRLHSMNPEDCQEAEVTPTPPPVAELPQTGAGDGILNVIGGSALITSLIGYAVSRRTTL